MAEGEAGVAMRGPSRWLGQRRLRKGGKSTCKGGVRSGGRSEGRCGQRSALAVCRPGCGLGSDLYATLAVKSSSDAWIGGRAVRPGNLRREQSTIYRRFTSAIFARAMSHPHTHTPPLPPSPNQREDRMLFGWFCASEPSC